MKNRTTEDENKRRLVFRMVLTTDYDVTAFGNSQSFEMPRDCSFMFSKIEDKETFELMSYDYYGMTTFSDKVKEFLLALHIKGRQSEVDLLMKTIIEYCNKVDEEGLHSISPCSGNLEVDFEYQETVQL